MVSAYPNLSRQLSPEIRIALNVIRALAAGYVVLHHIAHGSMPIFFEHLLRFGQEAVITFFLLSGFVIHANERHRVDNDLLGYLFRRGSRIYPTLCVAMAVSVLVAFSERQLAQSFSIGDAFCTLFAMQDIASLKPGTICSPFMGNSPLWSLSYEVVFYLLYPIILRSFLRHHQKSHHLIGLATLVLIIGYVSFPSHFFLLPSYFLIWWCGAMMAERFLNMQASKYTMYWPMIYLGIATLIWSIVTLTKGVERLGTYPALMLRHFGVSLAMLGLALSPIRVWILALLKRCDASVSEYTSGISYGIYVLHYPLLVQWHLSESWAGMIVAIALLFALSDLADFRMNKLIRRLLKRTRAANSEPSTNHD